MGLVKKMLIEQMSTECIDELDDFTEDDCTDEETEDDSIEPTSDDWRLVRVTFRECLDKFLKGENIIYEVFNLKSNYYSPLKDDLTKRELTIDDFRKAFTNLLEYKVDGYGLEHDYDFIEHIISAKKANYTIEYWFKPFLWEWLEENSENAKEEAKQICEQRQAEEKYYEFLEREAMPYKEFLQTDYWQKEVRPKIIERDKRCRTCGTNENLEVHHISYEHRGDDLNHMEDLTLLCRDCHQIIHDHYIWS